MNRLMNILLFYLGLKSAIETELTIVFYTMSGL